MTKTLHILEVHNPNTSQVQVTARLTIGDASKEITSERGRTLEQVIGRAKQEGFNVVDSRTDERAARAMMHKDKYTGKRGRNFQSFKQACTSGWT